MVETDGAHKEKPEGLRVAPSPFQSAAQREERASATAVRWRAVIPG